VPERQITALRTWLRSAPPCACASLAAVMA
jgi:hypothetical protein